MEKGIDLGQCHAVNVLILTPLVVWSADEIWVFRYWDHNFPWKTISADLLVSIKNPEGMCTYS